MHTGAPAEAVVREGDRVRAGELIAASQQGKLGANIHASISGRVASVGDRITIIKE
jgi:Na+-translocating ferredoxin:NAD+ oxidoreductase RnfC subunit